VDGEAIALFFGCWSKDEHIQMEEEPPKGGGVVKRGARSVGHDDGPYYGSLEVRKGREVPGPGEASPSCAEVRWFMKVSGTDEGETVFPVILSMGG